MSSIKEGKIIIGENFTWNINTVVNYEARNVVYLIECNKPNCKKRYTGETEKIFRIQRTY